MFSLILIIVSIALVSALVLATVQFVPWWVRSAADTERVLLASMPRLENAYDVAVRAADGVSPVPDAEAPDGGLATHFLPHLRFTPAAPGGFSWVYGRHPVDASRYSGMSYFCLRPSTGVAMQEGVLRGAQRVRVLYSPDQVFLAPACGATANASAPQAPATLALTMFVAYTPGVTP
jgi:hypothetical protein